jgi:hypothetical protein
MLDGPREHPDFFDGSVLRWARVAGLALGEIVYPPAKERPVHAHDRASFHYLLEGGYVEQHGRNSRECTTNTLVFQPAGHEHSYRGFHVSSRSFTIELDEAWTARLREHGVALESPGSQRDGWRAAKRSSTASSARWTRRLAARDETLRSTFAAATKHPSGCVPQAPTETAAGLLQATRSARRLCIVSDVIVRRGPVHLAVSPPPHRCTGASTPRPRVGPLCGIRVRGKPLEIAARGGRTGTSPREASRPDSARSG